MTKQEKIKLLKKYIRDFEKELEFATSHRLDDLARVAKDALVECRRSLIFVQNTN